MWYHLKLLLVCLLIAKCCDSASTSAKQVNPCSYTTCRYGANCIIREGKVSCECPPICMTFVAEKPICGSDGQTYYGVCAMEHFACVAGKDVSKVSDGECPKMENTCTTTNT